MYNNCKTIEKGNYCIRLVFLRAIEIDSGLYIIRQTEKNTIISIKYTFVQYNNSHEYHPTVPDDRTKKRVNHHKVINPNAIRLRYKCLIFRIPVLETMCDIYNSSRV